jgi:hypothetical protein
LINSFHPYARLFDRSDASAETSDGKCAVSYGGGAKVDEGGAEK